MQPAETGEHLESATAIVEAVGDVATDGQERPGYWGRLIVAAAKRKLHEQALELMNVRGTSD